MASEEKCCKKPKLTISNNILFKCLECRRYFTNARKSICHVRREFIHNNYAHLFILLCITIIEIFVFFRLQISVKKHTMVCKACNSHVHNTNDMTITLKRMFQWKI